MDSILIVIQKPKAPGDQVKWQGFVADLRNEVADKEGIELLNDSALLIREAAGLPLFGYTTNLAYKQNLEFEVLFLEKLTRWKCVAE